MHRTASKPPRRGWAAFFDAAKFIAGAWRQSWMRGAAGTAGYILFLWSALPIATMP
jgi:hypothetical protein